MTKKSKKKSPLTNSQAAFVLRGMLQTISRIEKECKLPKKTRQVVHAKAGILGLIMALKDGKESICPRKSTPSL